MLDSSRVNNSGGRERVEMTFMCSSDDKFILQGFQLLIM